MGKYSVQNNENKESDKYSYVELKKVIYRCLNYVREFCVNALQIKRHLAVGICFVSSLGLSQA